MPKHTPALGKDACLSHAAQGGESLGGITPGAELQRQHRELLRRLCHAFEAAEASGQSAEERLAAVAAAAEAHLRAVCLKTSLRDTAHFISSLSRLSSSNSGLCSTVARRLLDTRACEQLFVASTEAAIQQLTRQIADGSPPDVLGGLKLPPASCGAKAASHGSLAQAVCGKGTRATNSQIGDSLAQTPLPHAESSAVGASGETICFYGSEGPLAPSARRRREEVAAADTSKWWISAAATRHRLSEGLAEAHCCCCGVPAAQQQQGSEEVPHLDPRSAGNATEGPSGGPPPERGPQEW
ncbi:hypothetical protein cyc_06433 [Cyclospora cayetanensis]|uniref:Uncharacterized protein n=1 Tax=Cyclospora cayetanensis TaxID=88456 RepID=A0A1D3CUG4_9EIME|nr:hypothetical protein cyc_06433 [Cyclospora cayetanensis]